MNTTNELTLTITPYRLPQEMQRHAPGVYSIHYYGEAAGVTFPWDGRSAAEHQSDDKQEAIDAGALDEDGDAATCEVLILLVGTSGDCWLLDKA